MNGCLLDTNVISELTKPAPAQNVIDFLSEGQDFWVSTVTLYELSFGIGLMPDGKRKGAIAQTVADFTEAYSDRVIALGPEEAEHAATLRVQAQKSGQTVSLGDVLIAGTARAHDLSVATRNVSDFQPLGVKLINPWQV